MVHLCFGPGALLPKFTSKRRAFICDVSVYFLAVTHRIHFPKFSMYKGVMRMQIKTPASLTVWHLNGKDESQNKTTKNNRKMTKTAFPIGKIVFDIVTLL